jgi:hypothetical protein
MKASIVEKHVKAAMVTIATIHGGIAITFFQLPQNDDNLAFVKILTTITTRVHKYILNLRIYGTDKRSTLNFTI